MSSWLPAGAAGPGMPLGGPHGVIGCFSKAPAKPTAAAPPQWDFREFTCNPLPSHNGYHTCEDGHKSNTKGLARPYKM